LRERFFEISSLLRNFGVIDALDILLVALINYKILMLIRGTRAWRVVLGGIVFLVVLILSTAVKLSSLHWLLDRGAVLLPVAIVILLMPELRQLLEGMTRLPVLNLASAETTEVRTIEEIVASTAELSAGRVGALIVIERKESLEEIVSTGVLLNARVSAPLLGSVFYEGNPLHDGAVVIRGDNLTAAACRLPLSESRRVDRAMHMRHRAALGVSEAFDCVTIVVSEERGTISCTIQGNIFKLNGPNELRDLLHREIRGQIPPKKSKSLISFKSKEPAQP
jgi:diadenylate cyclase